MSPGRGRGQHAGLDARTILRAAIRLADRDGLGALSMRRLGADLGVEAMAIYHHFSNKDALLDGMVEELAVSSAAGDFSGADWQHNLRRYSLDLFATLTAHPNLVPLVFSRPAVTAGNLRLMESLLHALRDAGFGPARALDMVYALNGLVLTHAALAVGVEDAPAPYGEPGQTSRLVGLPADTYPLLVEAARASLGRPPTARFEFALDALLAGFAESATRKP